MARWVKGQSGNKKGRPKGPSKPEKVSRARRDGQDYLYVFEQKGYFKIGISNNPSRRLACIQSSTPFDVKISLVIRLSQDAEPVEKSLHEYFVEKHARGEWYRLTEADVEFIQSYANEYNQSAKIKEFQTSLI